MTANIDTTEDIIQILANLQPYLRKPIIKNKLDNFFKQDDEFQIETINLILKSLPNIDLEKYGEIITTWLEILADFDLVIEQKNAQVSIGQLPLVQAIPLQMSQLFGNLLSNALKYTKPGTRPEISINAQPVPETQLRLHAMDLELPYIKIEVRDNGIGFSQQYAEQIFNIFQRLHGNDQYSGTGIGLAMCRKIMQNHNGEITAASQEGSGTVFTIIMPAVHEKNGG